MDKEQIQKEANEVKKKKMLEINVKTEGV